MTDDVVEILADSIGPHGVRLTTFRLCYPRAAVHEDFLTHRDFSRNASSSRAIPVERMMGRADWMPEVWGKNRRGMGAAETIDPDLIAEARGTWRQAMLACQRAAARLADLGVAKEDANLLLRPFEWIDVVVSSTRWRHFFDLRGSGGNARRQCQRVADAMRDLLASSRPARLEPGWWHLPYVRPEELAAVCAGTVDRFTAAHASAMRCARVSYARHDGTHATLSEDADACATKLIEPGHWSPLEHAAACVQGGDRRSRKEFGNFDPGWQQLRKMYVKEYVS